MITLVQIECLRAITVGYISYSSHQFRFLSSRYSIPYGSKVLLLHLCIMRGREAASPSQSMRRCSQHFQRAGTDQELL
jgi:hypothetical protein